MSIDDYEENRFQHENVRRARKPHECCACHEIIRRGDLYAITSICNYDGGCATYKHCLRCNAIAHALWRAGAGMIDMHLDCGHTWEEADHSDGKHPPPEVARLAFLTANEAQRELAVRGPATTATAGSPAAP